MHNSFPLYPISKSNGILLIRKTFCFQPNDLIRKKMRGTLRHILDDLNSNHLVSDAFSNIQDSRLSMLLRAVWFFALASCLSLCVYQTYDRICYFLTSPVAVDVLTNHVDTFQFPLISMCSQDTEEMDKLAPSSTNIFFKDIIFSEFNHLGALITHGVGNLSYLWQATDKKDKMTATLHANNHNPIRIKPGLRCHPIGICHVYHIKQPVVAGPRTRLEIIVQHVKKLTIVSTLTGDIKSENQQWDMRNSWFLAMGITADIMIAVKKYIFLNTSSDFCASNERYTKCLNKCLKREHDELNANCKYPFFPDIELPNCTLDRTNLSDYIKSSRLYFRLDPVVECGCLKNCERVVFDWNEQVSDADKSATQTVINVRFKENGNISVVQRYSYDYVTFLGDIGGNFGLFLNLSLLAICDIVHVMIKKVSIAIKSQNQVGARLRLIMYKQTAEILVKTNKRHSSWRKWKLLRYLIFAACVSVATAQIVMAFQYYLSNPITTSIIVTENRTIYFPAITLCGNGPSFTKLKTKMMKSNKTTCEYDFQQVLRLHDESAINLMLKKFNGSNFALTFWNYASFGESLSIYTDDIYNKTFWEMLGGSTLSEEITPFGYCHKYKIDPLVYGGTHSAVVFIHSLPSSKYTSIKDCQPVIQLFLNEQTEPFSLISQRLLPTLGRVAVTLAAKKVQRLNRPQSPCVDSDQENACQNKCLRSRLQKEMPCGLPFLDLEISLCSNINATIEALDIFLSIVLKLKHRDCGCWRPCVETIYDVRIHNEYYRVDSVNTIIIFFFRHNFIESVTEKYSYSFVTFLCNIGGMLGLALGVCILSVVGVLHMVIH